MAILKIDLSALPPSARKSCDEVFRSQTMAEIVLAKKRQAEIADHYRQNPPRAIEGLGGMNMAFDPFLWSAIRRVCNVAPGEDAEAQAWMAKRYPIFRVRHQATKVQVGYCSTPEFKPRFKKSYSTT